MSRRSLHRSRSTSLVVAMVALALTAAWIGTEAVLQATGHRPLLGNPQTIADLALQPRPDVTTLVEAVATGLLILGLILILLAVTPGRRPRSIVEHDRGAVVIDDRLLAATAANAAARAARVPDSNVSASARRYRVEVRITPLSGIPVDSISVEQAVFDRLRRLGGPHQRTVKVRVAREGTLA